MVNCLIKEIEIRHEQLVNNINKEIAILSAEDEAIETIYFGGGTPSLLSQLQIERILSSIKENYKVDDKAEITLEANPDDINAEQLTGWKKAGVNRLSIGIQSFVERDLVWMNRAHNSKQAEECIRLAIECGFNNFSIDLIFGVPNLSDEEWVRNVQKVIDLQVPHIACYALTVEPKTALYKMIQLKKKEDVNTDAQAAQYLTLMKMMREAGYGHYEISNFAKPGFRSRHNSSYWQRKKYIGIGPSAHSYNGGTRMWNQANNALYIQSVQQNIIPFEKEILTKSQKLDEYIMTSLRTIEGMNLRFIEEQFSAEERKRVESVINKNVEKTYFFIQGDNVILTDEGKLFADGISVKLFV